MSVTISGSGQIIKQVINTIDNSTGTYARSAYITGLQTSITPTNASNKILIMISLGSVGQDSAADIGINVFRNGTQIQYGTGASSTNCTVMAMSFANSQTVPMGFMLLDNPATTSAVTYTFQAMPNSPRIMYYNRRGLDLSYASSSNITLMEVAYA